MIKTIDTRCNEVARGAVLRHAHSLFARDELRYDSEHAAGLSEIVVGEIDEPGVRNPVDFRVDGLEQLTSRNENLELTMRAFRPGLIAIPIGNRYAPTCLHGGLENPVDRKANGEVTGGSTIVNLCAGNIAGFVNHRWPPNHPLTHIRVLGTVVDAAGRPISLRDFMVERPPRQGPPADGVLVGGAGMEVGKTTFCCALFQALRTAGTDVSYFKATGTSCFLGDPLRVQTGDPSIPRGLDQEVVIDSRELRVSDFVDACGVPSDLSTKPATFVEDTIRYLASRSGEVGICELADSLHHQTNLLLLRSPVFRSHFRSLVYVVDPSLDAAQNFIYFIRDVLGWAEVRLAFAGPLATDPRHQALRDEIWTRFGVPCLEPADEPTLLEWAATERTRR